MLSLADLATAIVYVYPVGPAVSKPESIICVSWHD